MLPRVENLEPQPKPVIFDGSEAEYQKYLVDNGMVETTDDYVSQTAAERRMLDD